MPHAILRKKNSLSYPIPEGRRNGELRFNHQYRVVWWEMELSPDKPEQWYWKLLKDGEPVNGGLTENVQRCMSEGNWAFNRIIEGSFCAIEEYDVELRRTVTRLQQT